MNNWKEHKLGEIINFRRGHDLPRDDMINRGIPVVGSNGIIGYHNEYTTKSPCITIGRSGNVGSPFIVKQDCWAHNTTLYIDDFKGNEPKFIFYFLKTLNLGNYRGGSAVPTLNRNHIHPIEVKIPDLPTQRRIAAILSALDDKIENNRCICETLEQIAQAVFKRWFVDFEFPDEQGQPYKSSGGRMVESELGMIPEGWEVEPIKYLIDYYIGGDWGKDECSTENNSKFLCIRGADFPGIQSGNPSEVPVRYTKSNSLDKRKLTDGDIVLEISGGTKGRPVGRTIYINKYLINANPHPYSYSNFCRLLRTKEIYNKYLFGHLTYIYSTGHIEQYQVQSTGIANFQFQDFLEKEIILIPSKDILEKFNLIISSLYDKKYSNQNAVLQQTRDTLLPKLMSGEVEV